MKDDTSADDNRLLHGAFQHLADLERALDALAACVDDVAPTAVFDVIEPFEVLNRRAGALRAKLLARASDGGLWAAQGLRSFGSWMATRLGADPREVRKTVREAIALRDTLPQMRRAAESGAVSWGHVASMARHTVGSDKQIAALQHPEAGEEFLVAQAEKLSVPKFRYLTRVWAHRADPDLVDARWQEQAGQEYFVISETMGGYHLQGWLSEINGKTIATAIQAAVGTPTKNDGRGLHERNAQGLVDIAQNALRSGEYQPSAAVRPHLTVTVEYETLRRLLDPQAFTQTGPDLSTQIGSGVLGRRGSEAPTQDTCNSRNQTDGSSLKKISGPKRSAGGTFALERAPVLGDGIPLTARQLAFISCDSTVSRIVFGPHSEVLDVGRAKRTVTSAQRKAVQARDRNCQFPGCGAAPYTAEVHHVKHWAAGGETSVDNSILLCRFHHKHVHQRDIQIRYQRGRWIFIDAVGRIMNDSATYARYKQDAPLAQQKQRENQQASEQRQSEERELQPMA